MPRLLGPIAVECTGCGHRSRIGRADFEDRTGADLTFDTVGQIYSRLVCRPCRGRAINVHDDAGRLLIDSSNVIRCRLCNDPILLPRLNAVRGTTLWGRCANAAAVPPPPPAHPQPPPDKARCPRCRSPTVVRENSDGSGYFLAVPAFRDVDGLRPSRAPRHDYAGALSVRGRFPGSISEQADLARAVRRASVGLIGDR
jgi:hypothetical protein